MENMQLLTDQELVKGFIGGSEECINILVERYKKRVFTYILINVKIPELADDIFQDTFVKVFQSLKSGNYIENGKLASWMLRIAHNLIIDHYRRLKNQNHVSVEDNIYQVIHSPQQIDVSVEEKLAYEQVLRDVAGLMELLPPVQKEVVYMRYFQNLSFKEIADDTNVSINTALGRMRYAILNLRRLMEEKNLSLSI